jgi:5-aminopentanamidase
VRVAAYQAPLPPCGSMESLERIRHQVARCEMEGVEILCCPEAILGGLADYAPRPADVAFDVAAGDLDDVLMPLASDSVTTILGFTERSGADSLYNSAAVFHKGAVVGLYRKLHPAIRRSVYHAGDRMPVFRIGGLTFGIVICNDSNDPELARIMALQGATALFVPTNNGLPLDRADVSAEAKTRRHRSRETPRRVGHPSGCRRAYRGLGLIWIVQYRRRRRHHDFVGATTHRGPAHGGPRSGRPGACAGCGEEPTVYSTYSNTASARTPKRWAGLIICGQTSARGKTTALARPSRSTAQTTAKHLYTDELAAAGFGGAPRRHCHCPT